MCVCVRVLVPTRPPDAGSRGWAAAVHPLMPFPKQLVHDFPFVICDSSLHLVHAGVPVLRLWRSQTRLIRAPPNKEVCTHLNQTTWVNYTDAKQMSENTELIHNQGITNVAWHLTARSHGELQQMSDLSQTVSLMNPRGEWTMNNHLTFVLSHSVPFLVLILLSFALIDLLSDLFLSFLHPSVKSDPLSLKSGGSLWRPQRLSSIISTVSHRSLISC